MLKGNIFLCYMIGGAIIPFDVMTYENLALRKSTWQLHPIPHGDFSAERAVDGKKSNLAEFGGECTVSEYGKLTAEWRVDLGKILSIHHIFIQYATSINDGAKDNSYSAYFLGFSVYLSNTTNKTDGVLCFRDTYYTRSTIPNPVNITCPYHGRYVIYYNNRTHRPYPVGYSKFAYNCTCEMEVYGCPKQGRYGESCAISCPANCVDNVCYVVYGTCFGCSMGYTGAKCDIECDKHTFGENCSLICGNCVNGERCNHVDGSCSNGCDSGSFGRLCDKECPSGLYDYDCQENCSAHCGVPRLCDRKTGSCTHACQSGWKGNRCIRECDGGFFGHNCAESCGECFGKEQCHHVNGSCLKGCAYGYSGFNCTDDEDDHSRVVLKADIDYSDYINANYIQDNNGNIGYIATQGPKNSTINDFWQMVWQENVTQIVMLTNLMEDDKIKCNQYWPESTDEEYYGDLNISKREERHFAFYVIRKFTMSHSEESRVVTQHHYTKWPDHGTPDPLSLVVFHSHVLRTRSDNHEAPTIVHCSAGIGRTGTYIAFDALCKEGKSKGTINVASYVKVMRSCRMNMVHTYEQYNTIYMALNEGFKAPVHTRSIPAFRESMKHCFREYSSDHVIYQKEFKTLSDIKQAYTEGDFKDATLNTVNTKEDVLLSDKYNLYLTPTVSDGGNFINAVFVSSFCKENAFIVTTYPLKDNAVDFLRLLIDCNSDTVICMDPLAEIESSTAWLPEPSSFKMFGPFSLQQEDYSEIDVKVTSVKILDGMESTHSVKIVEPLGPLDSSSDTACLRSVISYVMHIPTEKPVTILSKDGATLCGVFCAVFNCIQQINMDDSVDVFTTVRQLQTRRPDFCSTLEEYMLVYRSLRDYIESTSEHVYSNQ
uniref:Receptor-type tyrosine-protein phosphatase kappa-like n=1 Tax=Crassostrea virginica TaxID=6565 RepID=A0A8B8BU71_CRAVI|nr:receptor-type tyrosine-protein phosphatase kappa-like [Crassostrea virginica]